MPLEIVTLKEEHLDAAAELVSARYTALRRQIPVLPARYENVNPILELLHDLPAEADGVIAVQDGALVGFLLAFVIPRLHWKAQRLQPGMGQRCRLGSQPPDLRRDVHSPLAALGGGRLFHAPGQPDG